MDKIPRITKTQRRILNLLSDGKAHTREEVHALLWDEESNLSAIRAHICFIRKSLRPIGQDIVCELVNRRICYRHIVYLTQEAAAVVLKS